MFDHHEPDFDPDAAAAAADDARKAAREQAQHVGFNIERDVRLREFYTALVPDGVDVAAWLAANEVAWRPSHEVRVSQGPASSLVVDYSDPS